MSRRIAYRHIVSGTLIAQAPVFVGAHTDGTDVDLLPVRDGQNRLVLPGTSLAGVIRSALNPSDESDDESGWWGSADDDGSASPITVFDAPAVDGEQLAIRDGVSIDRISGAAAQGHLYNRNVVEAGQRFVFRLSVEHDAESEAAGTELITGILMLLTGPGLRVGGATSSGFGHVRLDTPQWRSLDLTSIDGLRAAVLGEDSSRGERRTTPATSADAVRPGHIRITIPWTPTGPILSKIAVEGSGTDAMPLTRSSGADTVALVIPGSSVKGALRSHAERIVRTALPDAGETPPSFLQQMRATGLVGVTEIFGSANEQDENRRNTGRKGAVTVNEVVSEVEIPTDRLDAVREATTPRAVTRAIDALNDIVGSTGLWFDLATRTAIDRWSGGVSDGALYTTVEPYTTRGSWSPIVLELDYARLERNAMRTSPEAVLALLVFLLRDLCDGWVPIGFGVTRGLGSLHADPKEVTFDCSDLSGVLITRLRGRTLQDVLADKTLTATLTGAWQKALRILETTAGAAT